MGVVCHQPYKVRHYKYATDSNKVTYVTGQKLNLLAQGELRQYFVDVELGHDAERAWGWGNGDRIFGSRRIYAIYGPFVLILSSTQQFEGAPRTVHLSDVGAVFQVSTGKYRRKDKCCCETPDWTCSILGRLMCTSSEPVIRSPTSRSTPPSCAHPAADDPDTCADRCTPLCSPRNPPWPAPGRQSMTMLL